MKNTINRCKPLLGTYVEIELSGDYEEGYLLDMSCTIYDRIEQIQNLLSFHDENSELSYINSNAFFHSCKISREMSDVLKQALKFSELTDGLYDVCIASELVKNGFLPDRSIRVDESANYKDIEVHGNEIRFNKRLQIDLGGIAKGYAMDEALRVVGDEGVRVIINAGGDIISNNWEDRMIDIRVPELGKKEFMDMKMKDKAVATSSSYYFDNNKNPIISPKSRKMIEDKRSVSVFASNCMIADALTKIAFLDKNANKIMNLFSAKMIFINEQGNFC